MDTYMPCNSIDLKPNNHNINKHIYANWIKSANLIDLEISFGFQFAIVSTHTIQTN